MLRLLASMRRAGTTIIVATQDESIAEPLGAQVWRMRDGPHGAVRRGKHGLTPIVPRAGGAALFWVVAIASMLAAVAVLSALLASRSAERCGRRSAQPIHRAHPFSR
ncbi:MAG: hypothetical protein WDN76_07015 [Alphaproteobacteria bacterium]